jgi:hypothetical protein
MTELLAPFGAAPEPADASARVEAASRTPVLITEQQVLFATAAAVPLQPAKTGRRWVDAARTFLLAAFLSSGGKDRQARRHYPPRSDFLEDSRMAREMTRL